MRSTLAILILLASAALLAPAVLASERVTLTVYGQRSESVSASLVEATPRLLGEIKDALGIGYDGEVSLVVCTDSAAFHGYVSEFARDGLNEIMGVAVPSRASVALNLEMIDKVQGRPQTVYKHELCHLVLARNIVPWLRPLWLEEGLAQWVSETPIEAVHGAMGLASGGGRDPESLSEVSDMAATPETMADGYAHALAAIESLESRHGNNGIKKLLVNLAAVPETDKGARVEEVYGATFNESFALWQKDFIEDRRRSWFSKVLGFLGTYGWGLGVLLAAGLMVWAILRKKRKENGLVAQWKEEDEMFPPDPSWAATETPERDVDTIVQESLDRHFDGESHDEHDGPRGSRLPDGSTPRGDEDDLPPWAHGRR